MDVVNISRSRRFLKERPIRVTLFDRPRLVCDLVCLEAGQTERRPGLATSDSLYVVIEGQARLRIGPQVEDLQVQDAALVPPGVDHTIENNGSERLTLMALVSPKPTRAAEVRMPGPAQPRGLAFRGESPDEPGAEVSGGRPPRERGPDLSRRRSAGGPPRDRRAQGAPQGAPRGRPRPAETEEAGPVWFPRPKTPWRPRSAAGPPAGGRRQGPPGARPRGSQPAGEPETRSEGRPRRTRFTGPPRDIDSLPPPRGRAGRLPAPAGQRPGTDGPPRGRGAPRDRVEAGGERSPGRDRRRGDSVARGRADSDRRRTADRPGRRGNDARGDAVEPRPAPRGTSRSAPRARGRSGPRTSGPRRAP